MSKAPDHDRSEAFWLVPPAGFEPATPALGESQDRFWPARVAGGADQAGRRERGQLALLTVSDLRGFRSRRVPNSPDRSRAVPRTTSPLCPRRSPASPFCPRGVPAEAVRGRTLTCAASTSCSGACFGSVSTAWPSRRGFTSCPNAESQAIPVRALPPAPMLRSCLTPSKFSGSLALCSPLRVPWPQRYPPCRRLRVCTPGGRRRAFCRRSSGWLTLRTPHIGCSISARPPGYGPGSPPITRGAPGVPPCGGPWRGC